MDEARCERLAYNEALDRQLNERKAEWMEEGLATAGFRCECSTLHCGARFQLSPDRWQEVHLRSDRFLVAPGHVAAEIEFVVEEYPDYWIVEKQGEAAKIAEAMD
ncbi:MAG: hypothetical protein ACREMY_07430 [bacterium]